MKHFSPTKGQRQTSSAPHAKGTVSPGRYTNAKIHLCLISKELLAQPRQIHQRQTSSVPHVKGTVSPGTYTNAKLHLCLMSKELLAQEDTPTPNFIWALCQRNY
ncbi:hypothetical protein PoB_002709500 [Plakobranchus ocellatus]|uniref:Uncharacterized protein n=1 Tax=Plakobranchus ocellatus TaxID=259542 RepID=A0AAV3ZZG6_9GAST|nr:hypothetical protein PoB_002709500 [Plakobranchus ocellatus]